MNRNSYPIAVIGGGIVGLCSALVLQARGIQTVLIERDKVGRGASWGNAGHLATEQVFPVADPSVFKKLPEILFNPLGPLHIPAGYMFPLMPWALRLLGNMRPKQFQHIHHTITQLNADSLSAWQRFSQQWQLESFLRIDGSVLTAEKQKTCQELKEKGDYLNSIGVANMWLEQAKLHEKQPGLSDTQLGGLFFPDTGHVVDLEAMMAHMLRQYQEQGGYVYEHAEVTHIKQKPQGHYVISLEQGVLEAEHLLISSGAFSKPFVHMLTGVRVPLETERGYHLMLPQETGRLHLPVSSADRYFIMTPMAEGLRLAGTVEYGGLKRPANMHRATQLEELAQPMMAKPLNAQEATPWMGFRPTLSDSLPVIDRVGRCLFAFGHQHLGLTQAALTAEMMASLFFDPDRWDFKVNRQAIGLQRFH